MDLKTFYKIAKFTPSQYYESLYYLFPSLFKEKKIINDRVFEEIKEMTKLAYPDEESKYDKRWFGFYLPVRRGTRWVAAVGISIMEYNARYFVQIEDFGSLEVSKGNGESEEEYMQLVSDIARLSRVLKAKHMLINELVPYSLRKGKILGKYVLKETLPENERREMLEEYLNAIKNAKPAYPISLNGYLDAAAVCYRAVFKDAEKFTPEEMYRKWADGRDCGMLGIADKDSKAEFSEWLAAKAICGGHPFEIVFNMAEEGLSLYPPRKDNPKFALYVGSISLYRAYRLAAKALIEARIAFITPQLEEALKYLAGETYIGVNERDIFAQPYDPSNAGSKKLFKHIIWDEIDLPRWRTDLQAPYRRISRKKRS